ncbi:MAG: recombinase family protein [Methanomicrobium sp.]|nr:recombinase family protein [Methanomicrobium sp.]
MTDIIGYVRVSTDAQSYEIQIDKIKEYAKLKDYNVVNIFTDHATGKNAEREGFQSMIEHLKKNPLGVEAIIIYKLDRMGRSLHDLIEISKWLHEHDIGLISITDNIDTTTSAGRFFFHMAGAFAEYERELILERTAAGLARKKAAGFKLGRPVKKLPMDEIKNSIAMGVPKTRIAKQYGISPQTLYTRLAQAK